MSLRRKLSFLFLALSIGLYIACMPLQGFCVEMRDCDSLVGYNILLFGWIGMASANLANLTWIANPCLFVSWGAFLFSKRFLAFSSGVLATAIAVMFLYVSLIAVDESGSALKILTYRSGYWVWLASIICGLIAALFVKNPSAKKTT